MIRDTSQGCGVHSPAALAHVFWTIDAWMPVNNRNSQGLTSVGNETG